MSARRYTKKEGQRQGKTGSQTTRIIVVVLAFIILGVYANWESKQVAEPLADEIVILEGEQIYAQNCAACHGEQGEGHAAVDLAPALNGDEHVWHHTDGNLQETILNGGVVMPSFRDELTNLQVIAVIRYFQTLWRPDQLQAQQTSSAQDPLRE